MPEYDIAMGGARGTVSRTSATAGSLSADRADLLRAWHELADDLPRSPAVASVLQTLADEDVDGATRYVVDFVASALKGTSDALNAYTVGDATMATATPKPGGQGGSGRFGAPLSGQASAS